MSDTLDYYDANAEAFVDSTFEVSMDEIYRAFLPHVAQGGYILDAGCGSGRDSLYFHGLGYRISAFDASEAINALARQKTGLPIAHRSFFDVDERHVYDGIWACASLLHLPDNEIPRALDLLWMALKPGATLYASFKFGEGERECDGRHFTDANEERVAHWFESIEKDVQIK